MPVSKIALEQFDRLIELDAAARADALREMDTALAAEVRRLLDADARASALPAQLDLQEIVGAYRLIAPIGEGGMGVVYRAERIDGLYSKPVALKRVRVPASELLLRFERERRILGSLSHAGIASLLDAGNDRFGVPFLVMELVDGEPLDRWCQRAQPSLEARVRLVAQILDTLQYAHARLVVHRDLKPGNVLVDAQGTPTLLDFGIAKLLDDSDLVTLTRTPAYTPAYASPEQVRGEPVGVASDLYSAGVLLYELLASQLPPAASRQAHAEAPVPSAVIADASLARRVRGDLDAITQKALAPMADDRYASAQAFADDLRRWLDGFPIRARAPGSWTRLRKFVGRHRVGASAGAAVLIAIVAGVTVALWQARIAQRERDATAAVNDFLVAMLGAADPRADGRDVRVADLLDRAGTEVDTRFADRPDIGARLHLQLSNTYRGLGLTEPGLVHARRVEALREHDPDASKTQRDEAHLEVGKALLDAGNPQEAEAVLRTASIALDGDDDVPREVRARAHNDLAVTLRQLGRTDEAREHYRIAQPLYDPNDAAHVTERVELGNNLGVLEGTSGHLDAAGEAFEAALAIARKDMPKPHPLKARLYINYADYSVQRHDEARAERYFSEGIADLDRLLGAGHPDTVGARAGFANLRLDQHRDAEALALSTQAADAAFAQIPEPHSMQAYAAITQAQALLRLHRNAEAVAAIEHALALREKLLPPEHWLLANTRSVLATAYAANGDHARALALAQRAVDDAAKVLPADHEALLRMHVRLEAIAAGGDGVR